MSKKKFSFGISPAGVNFIIIFGFLCFVIFSNDESSIRSKIRFLRDINRVENRIEDVKKQMSQDSVILNKILTNDDYLEQYARENLFMVGKDEVIFRIK